MTLLVWLVFALHLDQMSHPKMFPTSHLRTTRTRNQTKFQYISVPYGHVLITFRVPLRIFQLVDLQEPVAPYSYKCPFQIFFFRSYAPSCAFLVCLSFLQASSWHWIYSSCSLIASLQHNKPSNPSLSSFIMRITAEARGCLFFQGDIEEPVYDRLFPNHPLLKTHSNQEHYNANLHPPNHESIEKLLEGIINSVPVWRLSDWECVLHVYLFLTEFLEEILYFHPLLIFVW